MNDFVLINNLKPEEGAENGLKYLQPTGNQNYDSVVRQFNAYLCRQGAALSMETVTDFFLERAGIDRPATLQRKKSALKKSLQMTLSNASHDLRIRAEIGEAFRQLKVARPHKGIRDEKLFSCDEIEALQDNATPRLGLIVAVLRATGMRISELVNIRLSDCNCIKGVYSIRIIGKRKKERFIELRQEWIDTIQAEFQGTEYLFETRKTGRAYCRKYIWREINKLSRKALAGRPGHPHMFRHSFATEEIERTHDVKGVSLYLGHSSTVTTNDMYNQSSLDGAELLGAQERLFAGFPAA